MDNLLLAALLISLEGFVTVTNVGLEGAGAELDLTSLRRRFASALPPRLERPAASIGR